MAVGFFGGGGHGQAALGFGESPLLRPRQLEARRALVRFLDAYNRSDFTRALAQFTVDPRFVRYVGAGDCDYRRKVYVRYVGRAAVARWLRRRMHDHDRLTVSRIALIGSRGARIDYSRRTSDTLAVLSFPDGLTTGLASKVGFTTLGHPRLTQFANAGGEACNPR